MKNFIRFYFLFSLITVMFSCSNDDNSEESQIRDGGEIFTSQLVTIIYNGSLQEEYTGSLGAIDVNLIKTTDNELVFLVPSNIEPGSTSLKIPGLNGLRVNYDIVATELVDSPENTVDQMLARMDLFVNGLEEPDAIDLSLFQSAFVESFDALSDNEKEVTAKFYVANSSFINEILVSAELSRFASASMSRSINTSNTNLILRFKVSGVAFSAGVALAILAPEPIEKAMGALVAAYALKKFRQYKREIDSRNLKIFSAKIDGIAADFERNSSANSIEFVNNEEKTLSFEVDRRDFIPSDIDEGVAGIIDYVKSFDIVSEAIIKLNQVIMFVNDNVFFSNINLLDNLNENDSTLETVTVTSEDFNGFQFSVTDSNIEISSISFTNGELKLTLNIINESLIQNGVVNTRLKYNYNDDFNSISGGFDISITNNNDENNYQELILGTWRANSVLYNGSEIFNPSCYEELVFTSSNFTAQDLGTCDAPQSGGGDYSITGNTLTVNFTEGNVSGSASQQILELTDTNFVVSEGSEYVYSYEKTDVNIFGEWIFAENSNCVVSNGDTFTDNGSGELLTLNVDYTVVLPDDSNGNYLTNGFTFENNILTINLSYQDFFSPACEGVNFQTATNSMTLIYDEATDSFTGTSQSSRNDVIGSDCTRYGETCTGTVSMTR
ncbi:lipocalin family protein [Psychroserpens jangbogonensis]|uniref:lipocalin family protein n=1 Tax=Psychroserpens jangbogonensis TaxID=1484460 RepID=UPI00053DC1C5|nr:lipocalin family protein [Psychroserpens jangbogonensis]